MRALFGSKKEKIWRAAKAGDNIKLTSLLKGATTSDLNFVLKDDMRNHTALMIACFEGHVASVQLLIQAGAELDFKDPETGMTALIRASERGHTATVKELIQAGANADCRHGNGWPPLICAVNKGHTAAVQVLVQAGASLDIQVNRGQTALMLAARSSYKAIVQVLLEAGVDTSLADEDGKTALDLATSKEIKALLSTNVPSAPASTATPSAYSPPASAGSRPSTAKQGYMTGDHIITNLQPLFGSSTALRDASLRVMLKGQFHTRDSAYDALLSHNCVLKCAAEEEGKEPPAARLATLRRELSMYQAAQQLAKERGDVGTGCVRCFPVRPDTTYLVLEDHGNDLRALLAANPRSPQLVVEAVVQAVQALHSLGIMHGDIKPQNLLCSVTIAGHYVVKLCDLEGAYRVGDMCPASGTRYFMAPEVRIAAATAGLIQASLDKDMFPLGLVIWQVMRRTVIPALSCADDAVEAHLYADQSALNAHLQFHALYKPFMEQVVSINPVHRISISELSNHIRRLGSTSIMEDAVRREEDLQFLKQNVSSQLQSLNAKMDNLLIEVRSGFSALNGSVVEVADTLRQEVLSGGNRSQVLESMILAAEDSFSRLSEAASPSSQLQRSTPAAHGESIRVCLASMQERICASVAQTAQLHAEKCNREMQASLQTLAVQVNERFSGLSASVQEQINEQRHSTAAAAQQHETFAETSRCLAGSVKEMLDSLNHIREELAQLKSAQEQLGRQMGQVLRDNKELGNMLQTVISGTHSIPTLSIILPDVAKSWLQSHSPMRLVRHQYRLFFLCAHTHQIAPCGPKGKGYKITATKQWVIDAAPVLRVGLVLVKLALMASGLPLPVPDLCTALVGSAMHTKYLDAALQLVSQPPEDDLRSTEFSMEKTLSEIKRYEVGDLMVAQGATAGAAAAERHLQEGSRKAYETIQALLVKDGVNIPLTCGLRQVTHRGRTAWVLDNDATEAAWKESM